MKKQKQMQNAFGINEFGLVDFPVKISNVQVSRIVYGNKLLLGILRRICTYGFEKNDSLGWSEKEKTSNPLQIRGFDSV